MSPPSTAQLRAIEKPAGAADANLAEGIWSDVWRRFKHNPIALAGFYLASQVQIGSPLIVAGTKYRGQFEERLKGILKELKESKELIVFIDEIHSLIGAGSAEGSLDAANILKPALSRG